MQKVDYIIMACAALVLMLVGIAFLPSGPTQASLDNAYYKSCEQLKKTCDDFKVTSITALTTGNTIYTLGNLCALRGYRTTTTCAVSCGCNVTGAGVELTDTPLIAYSDTPIQINVIQDEAPAASNDTVEYYGI